MKRIAVICSIVFLCTMSAYVLWFIRPSIFSRIGEENDKKHYALYPNKEFYTGLKNSRGVPIEKEKVFGGIVSHHFFMEKDIADFFLSLKDQHPKTIVIIGPNHFSVGTGDVLVSQYPYETPWGTLMPDQAVVDQLVKKKIVKVDEYPFEKEHSISALVGFIKYVFPNAKIVPIILKRNVSEVVSRHLADELNDILTEESLVIASVDFSHHQNRIAAAFHDEKSIATIDSFDFDSVKRLEVDSPASIDTLMKYVDKRGAQKMVYTAKNSAAVSHNVSSEDVTSYLFAHFTKGEAQGKSVISMLNFGGIVPGSGFRELVEKNQDPFEKIIGVEGNFFRGVDALIVELEGVIDNRAECTRFNFGKNILEMFKKNRINLIDIANKGTLDCGQTGFSNTEEQLKKIGISSFGNQLISEKSYIVQKTKDIAMVYIGVNMTSITPEEEKKLLDLVTELKKKYMHVGVNVYWGESTSVVSKQQQSAMAHALVNQGADIIIGYGNAEAEPIEIYKNNPIFYSIGNIITGPVGGGSTISIGVGSVVHDHSTTIFIFPFRSQEGKPQLLPYAQTEEFCSHYLKNIKTKDTCTFELPR